MPATHRLRVRLNAGAWQTGGVTAALGDTVALSPDNTVGVTSYRYEIYDYPPGFACPAGWSTDANSVYYSTAATPPDFTLDAVEWGKYALRLTVDGGLSEVIVGKTTRVQADPLLIDEETAISVPSGLGVVGLMQRETTQFGGVDWTRQVNNDLRRVASATEGAREPVRLAATANIADLSNAGANMDGVALVAGDRVLLPAQTTTTQNGIYAVASLTPTVLTRATDMAAASRVTPGMTVAVQAGDTHQASTWTLLGDGALVVGTDELLWMADETVVDIRRFGARLDGVTDDTQAVKDARDSLGSTGGALLIPRGTLLLTDEIVISQNRTRIIGEGKHVTTVKFNPGAASKAAFSFTRGASVLYQCGLSGMSFVSDNVADEKIAIRLTDTSETDLENIAVLAWTGDTAGSVSKGIQLRGRELTNVRDISVQADRPISVEGNPNHTIDCDLLHLHNTYLMPLVSTEAGIYFDGPNVNVSSVHFTGYNIVAGGKYAVRNPGGAGFPALGVDIKGLRWEQAADASGFAVSWEQITYSLSISDSQLSNTNGVYLRSIITASIRDSHFEGAGGAVGLDVSGCWSLKLDNYFRQTGSTSNMGDMVRQYKFDGYASDGGFSELWTLALNDPTARFAEVSIEDDTSYTDSDTFSTTNATPHDTTLIASVPTNKHGTYDVTVWVTGVNQTSGALTLLCKRLAVKVADDGSCTAVIDNDVIGDQIDNTGVGGLSLTFAGTPAVIKATVTGKAATDLEWSLKADVLVHLVDHELGH